MNIAETYADTRVRLTALLTDVSDAAAEAKVPTCPEWTVHDVVAHLAGTCTDVLNGNLDGVATDEWTNAQVEARRGHTLEQMLEEWNEAAAQVETFADAFPGRAAEQWVADQNTHEHDIRGALGLPGGRDSQGFDMALGFFVTAGLASSVAARGVGPLEVVTEQDRWLIGAGEALPQGSLFFAGEMSEGDATPTDAPPRATVTAPRFELFRSLGGRRSREQIAAFEWSDDPEQYLHVFEYGPFTISPVEIVE